MLADASRTRHLAWDACYNVRDTGGYATAGGRETVWGALLRADNLSRLTETGRRALLDYGVRTIVDLRSPFELLIDPPPFTADAGGDSPDYLNLEMISDAVAVADETSQTLFDTYRLILDGCRAQIASILTTIARANEGGVLVYCHAGKDRTGLVVALLLSVAGVDAEIVAADYALSERYLHPLHVEYLNDESQTEAEREYLARALASHPQTMLDIMSHLHRAYGGVEAYLLGCGVTEDDIVRIRTRLTG